jgi:hypothetical protein
MRDPIGDLQAESAAWEDAANDWKERCTELQRRLQPLMELRDDVAFVINHMPMENITYKTLCSILQQQLGE